MDFAEFMAATLKDSTAVRQYSLDALDEFRSCLYGVRARLDYTAEQRGAVAVAIDSEIDVRCALSASALRLV